MVCIITIIRSFTLVTKDRVCQKHRIFSVEFQSDSHHVFSVIPLVGDTSESTWHTNLCGV
jgi:hypothetical protein